MKTLKEIETLLHTNNCERMSEREFERAYLRWLNSGYTELFDCYNSYSRKKEEAFRYCEELRDSFDGLGLRITSFNTNIFTVAFKVNVSDYVDAAFNSMMGVSNETIAPEFYLFYITPAHNYYFPVYTNKED